MSYYENRIKALEEKVSEMAKRERMKAIPVEAQLLDSIARLKAEVERMEHQVQYWQIEANTDHARWLRALEDVERLRKAGDVMVFCINLNSPSSGNAIANWEAAKEGKPSV